MKKYFTTLALVMLLTQNVQGENYMSKTLKSETLEDASFVGSTHLTDIKAKELSVLGSLEFHNLTVEQDADVAGPITKSENGTFANLSVLGTFEASDIICKNLDIAGAVTATGLTVTGETSIVGSLNLKAPKDSSKFPNNLHSLDISAETISLEDTNIERDIVVHTSLKNKAFKWLGKEKKQVLHLLGKTNVKGNITFESGVGIIEQGPDAKIEGKVIGATVEKK
jgi:hypothetical protein